MLSTLPVKFDWENLNAPVHQNGSRGAILNLYNNIEPTYNIFVNVWILKYDFLAIFFFFFKKTCAFLKIKHKIEHIQ